MKTTFFIDTYDSLVIKINGNDKVKEIFENYFDCEFNNYYSNANYTINYCEKTKNIKVPSDANLVHAFLGAQYYTWNSSNIYFALAEGGQLKGDHFVKRQGKVINLYIGESEGEDIVFRIARELIFRHLLSNGFIPMHASSTVDNKNLSSVYFGPRKAGKTIMLCSKVHNAKEKPLATDVVMLKNKDDGFYCCGMPLKFSYDAKMAELFKLTIPENLTQTKVRIDNKDFDKFLNTKCLWGIYKVENFYQVKFQIGHELTQSEKTIAEDFDIFMDKWNFGDFLQLTPNFEINFNETYKKICYCKIEGDFCKYVK